VANFGVTVQKQLTAPLMLVALYSPTGTYDSTFLANYAYININDQLTRVPGIASVFGLRRRPVRDALLGQARPAGQAQHHGGRGHRGDPEPEHGESRRPDRRRAGARGQDFTYSVRAQGRLTSPEEFGAIVIRANPDGSTVRLRDVARVELGAQVYNVRAGSTASRPRTSRSTSCPGPTRSTAPTA
jgi:HAE1 family hydrophobic/amphiphilic exporter-1